MEPEARDAGYYFILDMPGDRPGSCPSLKNAAENHQMVTSMVTENGHGSQISGLAPSKWARLCENEDTRPRYNIADTK